MSSSRWRLMPPSSVPRRMGGAGTKSKSGSSRSPSGRFSAIRMRRRASSRWWHNKVSTETYQITVAGLAVDVVRKDIKNLHLGVYPPHGRIRMAVPLHVNDEAVRLFTISKLSWIKRQRAKFTVQERQPAREFVSGESHYYRGRRYRLNVVYHDAPPPSSCAIEAGLTSMSAVEATPPPASACCSRGIAASSRRKPPL